MNPPCSRLARLLALLCFCPTLWVAAQVSNVSVRIAAANITSGSDQSYETAGINIFKGLKPDIVAIQEFRAFTGSSGTTNLAEIRAFVDTAFGTNFYFYKETVTGYNIPNGIVSRWPIIDAGTWDDAVVPDRGFAWAQIDLPGSNDLYVVSLHLYSSGSAADRNNEALAVKANIQASFPPNAWVIVGGDFNTGNRSEAAVNTFKTFLSDYPIPTDQAGDPDTNAGRNAPYDYLLPSFSLTNYLAPVVFPSRTFTNGLVFDSRVYTPLSDVPPVTVNDSDDFQMQHMAVVKQFLLPISATNVPPAAPEITVTPQDQVRTVGDTASFSVTATGTAPVAYQWMFGTTNIPNATNNIYSKLNVQTNDAGHYTVIVTNIAGSMTSAPALLTVNLPGTNATLEVLIGWDVNSITNYGSSPLLPTTNAANLIITGLTRGAGVGTSGTAAARAWGGNGFDALNANAAVSAGDFATFSVEAVPGHKISFTSISRYDYRRSSGGPPNGVLQYQLGTGAFTDITTLNYSVSTTGGASLSQIDLSSLAPLQNVGAGTNITFRIVNYGASSSGGTWYVYDATNSTALDFAVTGTVAATNPVTNTPALPPTLSQAIITNANILFQLTGTVGSNYVVQAATNLTSWVSVETNAAPFWFTNPINQPQRFYRGALAP